MRYLFKRGDFFYFLRRIPLELQPQFGYRRQMRLSLGTSDRREAKKIIKQYDAELDKLWVAAKLQLPDEVIKTAIASSALFSSREAIENLNFSGRANQFLHEKQATVRLTGVETFQAVFKEFQEIFPDRNVQAFTHSDMIKFRDQLSKTGIKPTTINKKIRYLSVFFNWLVLHQYIKQNPCKGLTIRKTEPDHELKKIFTLDDIDRWFTSPAFVKATCRNYLPQHFWIPLIGLLGLRINEICQLRPGDIKDVEGVWCIDVNSRDGKQIKSLSSARLIPLPKFLLDIGFLNYWKNRQGAGAQTLSPLLFPVKFLRGNRPDYNYQVRRYIRKYVTKDGKKSFHSFRATLATMLKNLGARENVPEALIAQILGHANSSITMGRYGKP